MAMRYWSSLTTESSCGCTGTYVATYYGRATRRGRGGGRGGGRRSRRLWSNRDSVPVAPLQPPPPRGAGWALAKASGEERHIPNRGDTYDDSDGVGRSCRHCGGAAVPPRHRGVGTHGLPRHAGGRGRGRPRGAHRVHVGYRSEEHTSELQSRENLVC